ncbi:BrnA antitoxin family protein [Methylobacterium trifolii]|uniref:BrnA antitoxin family protein n=1 Tax=Methylobacterium trifolii TaxID=1003092 RepID=A0ABQ4TWL2_9HYPH|nr:BrnA antitoxin family protein [Methylobacterium trifolii]GJE58894.1 hypothetical protein MPOCJGCO_0979 [Methylobacterium trifolii]
MTKAKTELPPLTDADEARIQAGIASDPDNPEWTKEDFRNAVPFKDASPELYASWLRQRGLDDTAATERVTLTLDRAVLDRFRATAPGWEARMHGALRHAAGALPRKLPAA